MTIFGRLAITPALMPAELRISLGQHTAKGRKPANQDFHGAFIPKEPQLTAKGIAVVLADGISSSNVSGVASEAAVKGFLGDYFCTSDAWSVKKSAQRVLMAINSWLYAQTRQSQYRYDADRGYVCTLSAMVLKSTTAHIFHVGDTRIYRIQDGRLEQLTNDHRLWVSQDRHCLSRALGVNDQLEIDYHAIAIERGDVFWLATDGVYESVAGQFIVNAIKDCGDDLDSAARSIVEQAHAKGSADNLTTQIVRIDAIALEQPQELQQHLATLELPPALQSRMEFDGFMIVREIHASSRSHVYLAVDQQTRKPLVIKTPSIDLREDPAYLERFMMEDWIARRLNSEHVLKSCAPTRKRRYLYTVTEYIDGQTLRQWMIDHPKPSLETVRGMIEQISRGLLAFHRLEMLHQDLRPDNIMIDGTGTVKIIDFGATRVAGVEESVTAVGYPALLGTAQFTAPEYFLGEAGTTRSDLFSLGVIAYQMLSGRLPYGAEVSKARTRTAQRRLVYRSVLEDDREIPAWIDEVLQKATHPDPRRRYAELSEFTYDLRHPNQAYLDRTRPPLLERSPVAFWRSVALILAAVVVVLLIRS